MFRDEAMNNARELEGMKRARLIEENIGYEELAVIDVFSEDEVTFELQRQINKERKKKIALQQIRRMEEQIIEMKRITM